MSNNQESLSASPFRYWPLAHNEPCFRLLRLVGRFGPLRCELIQQTFANGGHVPYEAVSYVWGSLNKCEKLLIDGAELPITASLCSMLKYLRARRHQYLWIDAVCIDQENPLERNHQVQQMRRIYSNARRVIFHLGEPTRETDFLMEGLWLLQMATRATRRSRLYPDGDDIPSLEEKWQKARPKGFRSLRAPRQRQRSALNDLFQRPWFARAWVIQEVGNAKDGVVQCGRWAVSCQVFNAAAGLLQIQAPAVCHDLLAVMPTPMRRHSWYDTERDLYSLLLRFRHFQATHSRDRIYALLGICISPTDQGHDILVDYTTPEYMVVRDAIAYLCRCQRASLPVNERMTVQTFLATLEVMDSQVLTILIRNSAVQDVSSMLEARSARVRVTMAMRLIAAADEKHGAELMSLLLALPRESFYEAEAIATTAIRNSKQGAKILEALLLSWEPAFTVTGEMAVMIAHNTTQRAEIVAVLRRHNITILLDDPGGRPSDVDVLHWEATHHFFREAGVEPQLQTRGWRGHRALPPIIQRQKEERLYAPSHTSARDQGVHPATFRGERERRPSRTIGSPPVDRSVVVIRGSRVESATHL